MCVIGSLLHLVALFSPFLQNPPEWEDILKYYRGSELQKYFSKLLEDDFKVYFKPQYIDKIPDATIGYKTVGEVLDYRFEHDNDYKQRIMDDLALNVVRDRQVSALSGGELQRLAIAMTCARKGDVYVQFFCTSRFNIDKASFSYIFDEFSSFLDIKQRLKAAGVIRSLLTHDRYVIVVELDLSILDYVSDLACVLYSVPSIYGVVTVPFSAMEGSYYSKLLRYLHMLTMISPGINIFLNGFIPKENLRFRQTPFVFETAGMPDGSAVERRHRYQYPSMTKTRDDFKLTVETGSFSDSEVVVLIGENGTGETTFIKLLSGKEQPDQKIEPLSMAVAVKPQTISRKFGGTVQELLLKRIRAAFTNAQFITEVLKPMNLEPLMSQSLSTLSGGELQRVAIVVALGTCGCIPPGRAKQVGVACLS